MSRNEKNRMLIDRKHNKWNEPNLFLKLGNQAVGPTKDLHGKLTRYANVFQKALQEEVRMFQT